MSFDIVGLADLYYFIPSLNHFSAIMFYVNISFEITLSSFTSIFMLYLFRWLHCPERAVEPFVIFSRNTRFCVSTILQVET